MLNVIKLVIPSSNSVRQSAIRQVRFFSISADHLVTSSPSLESPDSSKLKVVAPDQTETLQISSNFRDKGLDKSENFPSLKRFLPQAKPVDRIHVKILFPFYARKDIVGSNGEHINRLGLEFNCWIQIAPYGSMFPGTRETILLVEGSKENVMKVIQRVKCAVDTVNLPSGLEQYEWARQRSKCLQILVPLKWGQSIKYDDGGKILSSMAEKHSLDQAVCLIKQRNGAPIKGLRESIVEFKGDDGDVMRAGNELIDMMLADGSLSEIRKNLDYKRFYTANDDLPPLVHIKLLLPSYVIRKFINNINSLRADTECNIKLSKHGHLFPGSFERVLMVEGEKENVRKAIEKVNDVLDGTSDLNENSKKGSWSEHREKQLKFLLPLAWGQKLIRNSGKILRESRLKNELTFIKLDKSLLNSNLNEAVLTLGGEKENRLRSGLELFESMLEDADKFQLSKNLNYQQFFPDLDFSEQLEFERTPEKRIQVKTLLPVYAVTTFMGDGGSNIKFLSSLWNCKITLSKYKHVYPGTNERVMLLEGSKNSVFKVLSEVRHILHTVPIPAKWEDKNWVKRRHRILRLIIPSSWVDELMTNDGAILRNIKEKYELDEILLMNNHSGKETKEAVVGLHGSDENSLKAANYILFEMMSNNPDYNEDYVVNSDLDYGKYYSKKSERFREPSWNFTLPDSFFT